MDLLLIDDANRRYYQVPAGVQPSPGGLAVRDPDGLIHHVDPLQVAPWEVSQQDATELLQGQVEAVLAQGVRALGEVVQTLGGRPLQPDAPDGGADALEAAARGLIGALAGALSQDPDQRTQANATLDQLTQTLRQAAPQLGALDGDQVEQALDRARDWLTRSAPDKP